MESYTKLRIVGSGSFGTVWLIRSKLNQRNYVLKEIPLSVVAEKERMFVLNEVQVLSQLRHKNIVRYKEAFFNNGLLCISMEFAHEGDLSNKIEKQAGLMFPQEQVIDWFVQLCLALKYIHGMNILHRDIKSQNIFLTKDNVVKLGDFGIACVLQNTLDHAHTIIGTPYYLSPEICQRQPYNHKSDIWALGCVLYELIALKHPFECLDFPGLVLKILHGEYEEIPKIHGPLLCDLVRVLLNTVPSERPSAKQILHIPAMKQYVDKVLTRGRIQRSESVSSAPRTSHQSRDKSIWRKPEVVPVKSVAIPDQDHPITTRKAQQNCSRELKSLSGKSQNNNTESTKDNIRVEKVRDNPRSDVENCGKSASSDVFHSEHRPLVRERPPLVHQHSSNNSVKRLPSGDNKADEHVPTKLRSYSTSQVRESHRNAVIPAQPPQKRLRDADDVIPKERKLCRETYIVRKNAKPREEENIDDVGCLKNERKVYPDQIQEECRALEFAKAVLRSDHLCSDISPGDSMATYMQTLRDHLTKLLGSERFNYVYRYLGDIGAPNKLENTEDVIGRLYEVLGNDDIGCVPLLLQLVQFEKMFS